MKYKEIVELTTKELKDLLSEEKVRYSKLKITHAVSPLDNAMKIKETAKNIARINTELRKRQLS